MKLVWTRRAEKSFHKILNHILQKFGEPASITFSSKAKDFTKLLLEFPEMGTMEVKNKQIRGFQLTRQTKLFYRIKDHRIIILTFFDSRQDPKKKPY